ncbi:hypothetical protein IB286_01890 [Spongiibacter sp. KMU-158]|uniref:Uncharacterized protein n=1 Tax=Spongiibacter pelagi TaxID=2760804 RepID=A0A927C1E9_9GAMM|nr:ETEC_3214 domain-containing protein [Spongiibacter pelagi]MBD2857740.1 hypothetical protein [Spongiibacter pelagi]
MDKFEQHNLKINALANRMPTWLLSIVLLFVGLGNFTDSVALIQEVVESISSRVSNSVEYERVEKVRTGLNLDYLQEYIGEPQVLRELGDDIQVKHYIDEKYTITLYTKNNRVSAYLISTRESGFEPKLTGLSDTRLGEEVFSSIVPAADFVAVEVSRNLSFYLESSEINFGGGYFLKSYFGWLSHAAMMGHSQQVDAVAKLKSLYDQQVMGEADTGALEMIRGTVYPNVFGFGELPIEVIQQGLLTQAEQQYFD